MRTVGSERQRVRHEMLQIRVEKRGEEEEEDEGKEEEE